MDFFVEQPNNFFIQNIVERKTAIVLLLFKFLKKFYFLREILNFTDMSVVIVQMIKNQRYRSISKRDDHGNVNFWDAKIYPYLSKSSHFKSQEISFLWVNFSLSVFYQRTIILKLLKKQHCNKCLETSTWKSHIFIASSVSK